MKVKYGDYTHQLNEATVQISRDARHNEFGVPVSLIVRWTIDGMLFGDDIADLTTKINALKTAYATDGKDLALLQDGGGATAHSLTSSSCYGGTRVTQRPSFPEGGASEYVSWRKYRVVVEGEILDASGAGTVVQWDESIEIVGGGPRFVFLETLATLPTRQDVVDFTTYKAVQQGSAIGRDSYPAIPSPMWPTYEHRDRRRVRRGQPQKRGRDPDHTYKMYPISWSYEFESDLAFGGTGYPNAWPAGS